MCWTPRIETHWTKEVICCVEEPFRVPWSLQMATEPLGPSPRPQLSPAAPPSLAPADSQTILTDLSHFWLPVWHCLSVNCLKASDIIGLPKSKLSRRRPYFVKCDCQFTSFKINYQRLGGLSEPWHLLRLIPMVVSRFQVVLCFRSEWSSRDGAEWGKWTSSVFVDVHKRSAVFPSDQPHSLWQDRLFRLRCQPCPVLQLIFY